MTKRHNKPDKLALVGAMRYSIEARHLLHLKGGMEVTICFHFDVEDPQGLRHEILCRMSEKAFGQFVADVGLDLYQLKNQKQEEPKAP